MNERKKEAKDWFLKLRNEIVNSIEDIDNKVFNYKSWDHSGEGGGIMGSIRGDVIEKGGVNISTVSGSFSKKMQKRIPGTELDPSYWATGISVVLHPHSPHIPSMHFNSRFLNTSISWFGGGVDITPSNNFENEKKYFHSELEKVCNSHDKKYYKEHKKLCDEYFYLKHRNETRGIGGVFFDYLNTNNFEKDLGYVKGIGVFFKNYLKFIINKYKTEPWTQDQKDLQLKKRGRYVEFNLLYDRGTKFGLETGGNTEAILMSMPPNAKWD